MQSIQQPKTFLSYQQSLTKYPSQTIKLLTQKCPKHILQNPIIRRTNGLFYIKGKNQAMNFFITMFAMNILTIITHTRRSIALSAPRNYFTLAFKYLFIPAVISALFTRDQLPQYLQRDIIGQALDDNELKECYNHIKTDQF